MLYCMVSAVERTPTIQELILSGIAQDMEQANEAVYVDLVLNAQYEAEYRVTCAAVDLFSRGALQSLVIRPSGTPYAPELIETVPEMDAVDVPPYVEMQLLFRYPVRVNDCQFCFFILYNTKDHSSVSLYPSAFSVNANRIVFATRQLESLTTYKLKPSTRELIIDVATGVSFESLSDVLLSFTTKEYNPTAGEVVYPVDSLMPVNGVIEVAFTNYLYVKEGALLLNTLSVDASNTCLQVKHPTRHTTSLFIHVADCVGHLFPDTSYTLLIPQGFLETRDGIESPRIMHVFRTDSVSYAPEVIDASPRFQTVPVDVPISLSFNQPVVFGDGYLFVSEYVNDEYVNSFNLPASKATFSESYPFKVTWDASLFSFKPLRRYVISWSENMVKNGAGQGVAASTADTRVEFDTDVSACSPDFIAEQMSGVFECESKGEQCVCRTKNVLAVDY